MSVPEEIEAADIAARAIAAAADNIEVRIERIQSVTWTPYPQALRILDRLEELFHHPRVERMPNLAIIGHTNNGKSTLLRRFVRAHTPPDDPNAEQTTLPVLCVDVPSEPDERRLYNSILEPLFSMGPKSEGIDLMLSRLCTILSRLETRMLVLDEFSNALAGTSRKQRTFLNALKNLGNRLRIPIVISGLPESLSALNSDPQLSNRFKPMHLPPWHSDKAEYARLLLSLEKHLGLRKPCDFKRVRVVNSLLDATDGLLGETVELLRILAIDAIHSERESIGLEEVQSESLARLGWVSPRDRPRHYG